MQFWLNPDNLKCLFYLHLKQELIHLCQPFHILLAEMVCLILFFEELKVLLQIQITSDSDHLTILADPEIPHKFPEQDQVQPYNESSYTPWTDWKGRFTHYSNVECPVHDGMSSDHAELWELFSGRPRSADYWVWCNISCVLESNQHQHFKRSQDGLHTASYCVFREAQLGLKKNSTRL